MASTRGAAATATRAVGDGSEAEPGQGEPSTPKPPGGDRPPEAVDWEFAQRVAGRVAGSDALAGSYHRRSLEADFGEATRRSAELVAEFTGLDPAVDVATGAVVDRQEWVALNLASFRRLLAPVMETFAERLARSPLAGVNRRVAGAEAGVLLGWFARRVLGQYDLFGVGGTGGAPSPDGAVYYVGPNVLGLEKRHGFPPGPFRLWIALHEVTHLVQFTGIPWMRGHFLDLVEESVSLVDPDPKRVAEALGRVVRDLRDGRNPLEGGGLLSLLASEEQRAVLDRVQALMALLEGHGNFVMDRLGAVHVAGHDRMGRVLRERRNPRGPARQVQRALGIEMKMRQYSVGERFFTDVEERAGLEALEALWGAPDRLPTTSELREPATWLRRVGVAPG